MTRAALLLSSCIFLVACSSRTITGSDASTDSGSGDAAATDLGPGHDAGSTDAAPPDLPTGTDAAPTDAGFDPLVPHPPAGATLCGHGTFTTADATMGCMTPSFVLDTMFLPDGGTASTPRDCAALSIAGGGRWEVWCDGMNAYVWARFDGVTNAGTMVDCHGASILWVDEGVWESGSGGGNGAHVSTYLPDGTSIVGVVPGMPQIATLDVSVGSTPGAMGSAKLFLLGNLQPGACPTFTPPTVLAGITVTWTAP